MRNQPANDDRKTTTEKVAASGGNQEGKQKKSEHKGYYGLLAGFSTYLVGLAIGALVLSRRMKR